jgi:hypothetical protein
MNKKDIPDASLALLDWIESQGISPGEAVPVLVMTISALIRGIADRNQSNPSDGAKIAGEMIRETVRQRP